MLVIYEARKIQRHPLPHASLFSYVRAQGAGGRGCSNILLLLPYTSCPLFYRLKTSEEFFIPLISKSR